MAMVLESGRRQLRAMAQWLSITLETSGETQARILYLVYCFPTPEPRHRLTYRCILQPLETALIRIAVDLDIFETLSEDECATKSFDELVYRTGADPALLSTYVLSQDLIAR